MPARLQRLWTTFAATVVVLTLVGVVVADTTSTVPALLPVLLVLALAAGALAAVVVVDRGQAVAAPADDDAAAEELRARLALQIAIAQAPALLAFALAFVLGPPWVVVVGGAASLAILVHVRPSRARLHAVQEGWRSRGHDVAVLDGDEP